MKIHFISLNLKENYERKSGRGYHLPSNLIKLGQEVKISFKHTFWRFYFDYLRFKPDIVVTQGLAGGIVGFFRKLRLIRKPVIFDWNDYYTEVMGRKHGITKVALLEYSAVGFSDLVTTVSPYLKSVCQNLGKKSVLIPSGISEDLEHTEKIKLPGKNKIKFLCVSEVSRYKRVNEIIDAVKGLNCDLILVGNVIDERINSKNIPKNVYLVGRVPHKKAVEYINSADFCVDPQDQDTSLKIWEYIYKGKAILCRAGRKAYLLEHKKNAYLALDFNEGMKELITNQRLKKEMEKNIKKIKIYKWGEISKIYLSLLEKIKIEGVNDLKFKKTLFKKNG
jgi:glycosyltransferase involved in cell wall biosynthesis